MNIGADAIAELSCHPNIVGMKDSNGDVPQLAKFLQVADPRFQVLTGTFSAWYPTLTLGVTGIISALANCCPGPIAQIQELFDAGDWDAARARYLQYFPLNAAVTGPFGIPGLKYVTTKMGYVGGWVRNPLVDSSAADQVKPDEILARTLKQ